MGGARAVLRNKKTKKPKQSKEEERLEKMSSFASIEEQAAAQAGREDAPVLNVMRASVGKLVSMLSVY